MIFCGAQTHGNRAVVVWETLVLLWAERLWGGAGGLVGSGHWASLGLRAKAAGMLHAFLRDELIFQAGLFKLREIGPN